MQIEGHISHKPGRKLPNAWRYIFTVNAHSRLVSNQLPNQGSQEGCRHIFQRWRERLSCHFNYSRYEIPERGAGEAQGGFLPSMFLALHFRLPPFSQETLNTKCIIYHSIFFFLFSFFLSWNQMHFSKYYVTQELIFKCYLHQVSNWTGESKGWKKNLYHIF